MSPKHRRSDGIGDLRRRIKRWEKWVMIVELALDRHCLRNPADKKMKSARAYVHNLRTQIRVETGYAQSTLPTILDFHSRKVPDPTWWGYIGRMAREKIASGKYNESKNN